MIDDDKCSHSVQEMRKRTSSNGAVTVVMQCTTCGVAVSTKRKDKSINPAALVEFDRAIRDRYWETISAAYHAKREAGRSAWLAEHDEYLRSEDWARRRAKVLARDNYTCRGCLERPAEHVHHLTYDRWKAELAIDLVSLCSICHEHIHTYQRPDAGGLR